jgi:thiaminase/transcriptional activator TenA
MKLAAIAILALGSASAQSLSEELWAASAPTYRKTLEHPFLKGLADGTLPKDSFRFYLVQDALYLSRFSQALGALASRAPRAEWGLVLHRHALEAMEEERSLHTGILAGYGVSEAQIASAELAPTALAYTNHLLASVDRLSFVEGLAAMTPCYRVYLEVGRTLVKRGSPDKDYQRWIDQYAGEGYAKSVAEAQRILDAAAAGASPAERVSARRLYILSARYEYLFWDMAWRREAWRP